MRLTLLGIAVLLHGLAHANAGMLAANDGSAVATMLWAAASVGFLSAGLGLLGVRRLSGAWRAFGMAAAGCSVCLLATYRPATAAVGLVVDLLLIAIIAFIPLQHRVWVRPRTGVWAKIGRGVVFTALAYVAVVIAARPWHSR